MRSKKELYQIILDNYKKDLGFKHGDFLCFSIDSCLELKLITRDEYNFISDDFRLNKPNSKQHKEFSINTDLWIGCGAWWKLCDGYYSKGTEIRIKFLEKMISINS